MIKPVKKKNENAQNGKVTKELGANVLKEWQQEWCRCLGAMTRKKGEIVSGILQWCELKKTVGYKSQENKISVIEHGSR